LKLLVSTFHIFMWFLAVLFPFFFFNLLFVLRFVSGGLMVVDVIGGYFRAKKIICFCPHVKLPLRLFFFYPCGLNCSDCC
jgi:hypothetical protein